MEKLKLKNFKAFDSEVLIPINRKNLLIYGENGAGKSSIYEAIKIIFFRERLISRIVAQTPEDQTQLRNEFWSNYNNKITNSDFNIEVNDVDHLTFTSDDFQVFMISIEELSFKNEINLKTLLENSYFSMTDIDDICENSYDLIQIEVNRILEAFNESVSIEIEKEDDYNITIRDGVKSISTKSENRKYFNEAKLNIIILLILFSAIHLAENPEKTKIIVLDDFITSLDSSNRIYVVKYIFEKFKDFQILIFTHNISFYNLIMYMIKEIDGTSTSWTFANLFEINNVHKFYKKSEIEPVKNIKDDFAGFVTPLSNIDIENIGNRVRKKFEVLLYEYSKLLMVGTVEDSKKILDRITKGKSAYFDNKYTASDLVDAIQRMINTSNPQNLSDRIQQKIDGYKKDDFENFKKILKDLKLYQKVMMHPLSHGVNGMPTFTIKEITQSLDLLEKMEDYLREMVDRNVITV